MRHQSILEYARFRWFKAALGLSVLAGAVYLWHDPPLKPYGGTWLGYALGTVGALHHPVAPVVRRAQAPLRSRAPGTVQGWLSAHVYLGTALLVVATLHTGFELGWNLHTLAYVLMVATVASGFYGVYIYLSVPGLMTANRGEETLDAMLLKVADLDKEIREKALSLPDQILEVVNASLDDTRLGGSFLRVVTGRDRGCPTAAAVRDLPEIGKTPLGRRGQAATTRCTRCCCRRTRSSRARGATCASRRGSTSGSTSTSRCRSRCSRRSPRTWPPCSSTGSRPGGRRETPRHLAEPQPRRPHRPGRARRSPPTGCASGATPRARSSSPTRASR